MAELPEISPSPTVDRIRSGHFQEKTGYRVHRPAGTTDWLLIYTIRGSGELGDGATRSHRDVPSVVTSAGDVILLRPGTLHDYRTQAAAARWELLWAHFHPRPDWLGWLDWPAASSALPGLMRLSINALDTRLAVERALRKMNRLAVGSHQLSRSLAMNALEEALLHCAKLVHRASGHDPRIEQAEAYLCEHLCDKVTLDELAAAVGLSVSRLSHLFKQHTGITPQRYYEVQRLERARQLLEMTGLSIGAIAARIGFDSPFYFTLRFKRYVGKSPRQYRKESMRDA